MKIPNRRGGGIPRIDHRTGALKPLIYTSTRSFVIPPPGGLCGRFTGKEDTMQLVERFHFLHRRSSCPKETPIAWWWAVKFPCDIKVFCVRVHARECMGQHASPCECFTWGTGGCKSQNPMRKGVRVSAIRAVSQGRFSEKYFGTGGRVKKEDSPSPYRLACCYWRASFPSALCVKIG